LKATTLQKRKKGWAKFRQKKGPRRNKGKEPYWREKPPHRPVRWERKVSPSGKKKVNAVEGGETAEEKTKMPGVRGAQSTQGKDQKRRKEAAEDQRWKEKKPVSKKKGPKRNESTNPAV